MLGLSLFVLACESHVLRISGAAGGQSFGGVTASGGRVAGNDGGPSAAGGTVADGPGGSAVGGSSSGGRTGGSGGRSSVSTTPVTDDIGQDPFARPATSGVLITSSDGSNASELILAADAHDGMFVAGATRNPRAMGLTAFDPGIESEAFVARLDGQGRLSWSARLKTCGVPSGIAAGPEDSVYVLCPFEPNTTTVSTFACTPSAVVDKLSGRDGRLIFEAQVKVPANPADGSLCPYGLGVDAQGRSYVGGTYNGAFPIARAMVSAVSAVGQQDWTFITDGSTDTKGSSPHAYASDVAVDSRGNVIFAGAFNGWMTLGPTKLTSQAVNGTDSMYNGFVGRLSPSGTNPTGWRFGGTVFDMATAIKPTSDGGFLVSGMVSSRATIGGKTVAGSPGGSAFIARFGFDGQAAWAQVLPGDGNAWDLAMAPDGKVHCAGSFGKNGLLATYDPATDQLTSRTAVAGDGATNGLRTNAVAVTTAGAIWIAGTFTGTIDLGTGPLTTRTVTAFLWLVN